MDDGRQEPTEPQTSFDQDGELELTVKQEIKTLIEAHWELVEALKS